MFRVLDGGQAAERADDYAGLHAEVYGDPPYRRATLVEMTEHGTEVMTAIRAARGNDAERAFGRLSPADRAELARILGQLRDPA